MKGISIRLAAGESFANERRAHTLVMALYRSGDEAELRRTWSYLVSCYRLPWMARTRQSTLDDSSSPTCPLSLSLVRHEKGEMRSHEGHQHHSGLKCCRDQNGLISDRFVFCFICFCFFKPSLIMTFQHFSDHCSARVEWEFVFLAAL